ncbi:MAG: tetratricopeptide repeat protein, partial [Acidobacteriota bacterium]
FLLFAQEQEATSLLGKPLFRPQLDEQTRADFQAKLEKAAGDYEKAKGDPDAAIWLGRRTAYLGRYREAITIYTRAIEQHPNNPKLYRHRGHRYLTVRKIDRAIQDFEKAAELVQGKPDEIEPDGLPNAKNIPTSTLKTNIFYHLGLAYYLKGDYEQAAHAYRECLKFSKNDDMLVAVTHWLYMTLRRAGKKNDAEILLKPIHQGMNVIEDFDYFSLCLLYKKEKTPEELLASAKDQGLSGATVSYGAGNWYFYNDQKEKGMEIFRKILTGSEWASFGYLAAEAELVRLENKTVRFFIHDELLLLYRKFVIDVARASRPPDTTLNFYPSLPEILPGNRELKSDSPSGRDARATLCKRTK